MPAVPIQPNDAVPSTSNAPEHPTGISTEYFESGWRKPSSSKAETFAFVDTGERFELNFNEADIRGVIDVVLGEMLKLDYVVSPAVQGRITLRTSRPVSKASLLSALEAALGTVSAVILQDEQTISVLPWSEAPQRVRPAQRLASAMSPTPGYAVEIIPLRYINANDMQAILDSFVPKGIVLQADTRHGHLVVAGSSQDRGAILHTIESFDVDWLNGMTFALYRLSQSRPEAIVTELREIFQGEIDLFTTRIHLVPLERMQAVLGVAQNKSDLELLREWIERLDVSKLGAQRIFVYNVQNGNAKDLVAPLRQVLTGQMQATTASSTTASPTPTLMPTPQVPAAAPSLSAEPTLSGPQTNIGRLVAIEENNSLMFHGTEDEFRVIQEALKQIDVLPRQVMIEAFLAEVTLNNNLRYGVQWFFDSGENTVTLSATDVGSVASQFPGFSYIYAGKANARIVLNALQSKTEVKILSAPKISVLNNQKASLQVGDQVPIVTQSSQGTAIAGAPVINTIQMRDTGVILEVIPRVNDNGNVILDVTQEVSEVAQTTSSGIDSPTIQRRKIHSVIATRDGFTVALGGLIRENGSAGNSGVPLLKDVPVIGNLFRSNTSDIRRTELVILLVPHVMRNQMETQSVADALVDGLEAASRLAERARIPAPSRAQ
ncbi:MULTISPECIES: type II secretion system secretin GspD [Nitrosomonas]|uniref:type II secretion system secretin GspD n=1 Tax=Nitrosomonas TaxID=914 RepID=UPI000945A170|nr:MULTISPECIES: type II secretion system secretin GspD [Nitrosomonas]